MNDPDGGVVFLPILLLVLWFVLWLYFLLPARMARNRNRSAFIWVLIGLFGSPILAVLLLLALGNSPAYGQDR
jgi:uncharacterized BrkB/YihY/UPF0761 family membrane protein